MAGVPNPPPPHISADESMPLPSLPPSLPPYLSDSGSKRPTAARVGTQAAPQQPTKVQAVPHGLGPPFNTFHFLRHSFLTWVGGWVRRLGFARALNGPRPLGGEAWFDDQEVLFGAVYFDFEGGLL